MRLAAAQNLWWLAVVPLVVAGYVLAAAARRHQLERIGHPPQVIRLLRGASRPRRLLRATWTVLALALLVVALARPQFGGRSRLVAKRGIDLVVALDFSKSMLARDVLPSRIDRAKIEIERLIESLGGDRVGLVAFAGEVVRYPLTTDYAAARLFWRDLGPAEMPVGGTAIGRALTAATELLVQGRSGPSRPQWIVLLTDGEDTAGDPLAAAREAGRLGIRVFVVGIGSPQGERVPKLDDRGEVVGWVERPEGGYLSSQLAEPVLREVAEASGGRYVRASAARFGTDDVAAVIASERKGESAQRLVTSYEEAHVSLLALAFVLLVAEACVAERRRGAA